MRPTRKDWWPDWRGETVVIAASGESQRKKDLDFVRGKARVIAINLTYRLCPWADVLYSSGASFWRDYQPEFTGLKIAGSVEWPGTVFEDVREWLPEGKTMSNSGAQAIVYAECWGAARILLTGFDMQGKHWHRCHESGNPYLRYYQFREGLETLAGEMTAEVINCSRSTKLDCFARMGLGEALG